VGDRPERRSPNKNSKVLEASNLRAFQKLYIIGNQWHNRLLLCLLVRLCAPVYCLVFGLLYPEAAP
jgi:hypothetical protein